MPFRAMGRGSWKPGAFTPADVTIITAALAASPVLKVVQGIIDPDVLPLTPVGGAIPMVLWLAGFGIGSILLAVGMWQHRHGAVWIGHALLGLLYLILAILELVTRQPGCAGATAVVCILHITLALRTGPRPIEGVAAAGSVIVATVEQTEEES